MASLINRLQRAFLGGASPEKVRALLAELAIPAGGSGENALREARRGFLRPISDEAILRDALGSLNLTGSGTSSRSLTKIRTAIFHSRDDSEILLRDGLNDLLEGDDLAGGGGGAPAWVPDNAVIHIDLVGGSPQGRAWVEGTGEVAVDTLLGADSNTESAYGESNYDPAFLNEHGYGDDNADNPAFIGALLSAYTSEFTARIKFYLPDGGSSPLISLMAVDGNDAINVTIETTGDHNVHMTSWGNDLNAQVNSIANSGDGVLNCVAFTIAGTRAEIAANGSDPATDEIQESDRPSGNPLVAALVDLSGNHIQSITIYEALPDTTGLSALSETGVTNTAPTAIMATWISVTEVDPTHATTTAAAAADPIQLLDVLTLVDPEGNPGTWTLTDDDGGNFEIAITGNRVDTTQGIGTGVHNFTVRGTDPGGLFVEQEFTITVTA